MKKVLLIGSCGAGKSTFSKRLHSITHLNLIHLDTYYHKPNWGKPSVEEWQAINEELVKGDNWILDGNYGGTMEFRMQHADTVIWLDLPRIVCTYRILKRTLQYRNQTRSDMAEGCNERFDWEFTKYVWNFKRDKNPLLGIRIKKYKHLKQFRLKSKTDIENFFSELKFNKVL